MTHPLGQTFVIVDGPSPFNCDICTSPIDGKHIATFVGDAGQSAICWETAEAIADLVNPTAKTETVAPAVTRRTRSSVETVA